MKKLIVEDTCIACGACIQIDEEHFEFSNKGLSTVKTQENLDSEALHLAIDACPVAAIRLEESEVGNEESTNNEEILHQEENIIDDTECNCDNSTKCENCTCHNNEEM